MTALQGVPTYGNGVGVYDVTDDKVALAGLMLQTAAGVVLPGVFYAGVDLLVTGTAGMAYSVAAYRCATTRGASGGVILGGNDGALSVSTTAAPGSNSRIDLIVHWQREFQVDGVDSEPVIFVVQGTAGAVPVAPSLASYPGAIELARATVSAGATATNGGGVTITQTAPFAAVHGTVARFRTTAERDARLTSPYAGMRAETVDTGSEWRYSGSAWEIVPGAPASISVTPQNSVTWPAGHAVKVGNRVYISVTVARASDIGNNLVAGVLPVGARPVVEALVPAVSMTSGFTATFTSVVIATNGQISLNAPAVSVSGSRYVAINCSFEAA